MKCTDLQELAALDAVGTLDAAGQARLAALINADPDARSEAARIRDAVASFALATSPPRTPSPGLRARLLDRIRNSTRPPQRPDGSRAIPGFSFVLEADGWTESRIPGVRVKLLAHRPNEGYRVVLAQVPPGGRFPRHRHAAGPEELYVISGDLQMEDRHLRAGDFIRAEAGSEHCDLISPCGCIALIVEPIEGAEYIQA